MQEVSMPSIRSSMVQLLKAAIDVRVGSLGCTIAAAAAVLVAVPGHGALSQTPGTIKIVVPNPPGAATDILARLLAEQVGRAGGPPMVVENRPGAGNAIGPEAVARAAPDGRTLLINANPFVI